LQNTAELWRLLAPELVDWRERCPDGAAIAIVGFGKMGILHAGILNLLKPGCVTAVVEKSRFLGYAASRITKEIKILRNIEELQTRTNVNAAYVTTPAKSHYNALSTLMALGVPNLFVEKPPTENAEQLQLLLGAKKSGQVMMVGLQKRFALPFRHARYLLSEGRVGKISSIRAYAKSSDITARTSRFDSLGKGCLLDLGIHVVDILTFLFEMASVTSAFQQKLYTEVDDLFRAEMRTRDNIPVAVDVTWSDRNYRLAETRVEVEGSDGTLTVTEDFLRVSAKQNLTEDMAVYKPGYYRSMPPVLLGDPEYVLEDIHFLQSMGDSGPPLTDLDTVATTMRLIDQMYEKAAMTIG
jgi:predicted dehydrogenase